MSNQILLASIVGPLILVLGLSVLIYADVWRKMAKEWSDNHLPVLGIMIFNLIFGLTIINLHNAWEFSPYVITTIIGWMAFIKAVVYFLVPGMHFKKMLKKFNCNCYYHTVGVVWSVLGAWLSYVAYFA